MKNRDFHFKLRKLKDESGQPWTVARIAEAIFVNRSRLNDVFNNLPGHGGNTRRKVVKFLSQKFPNQAIGLLTALGWDEHGEITAAVGERKVAYGTNDSTWNLKLHMEQTEHSSRAPNPCEHTLECPSNLKSEPALSELL